jgi:hypothetical protein
MDPFLADEREVVTEMTIAAAVRDVAAARTRSS